MSEPTKRTGLPNLLFQRTSRPTEELQPTEESQPRAAEPEQGRATFAAPEPELPSSPDSSAEPSPRRQKTKREKVRIRRTLHLEDELDTQLNTVAGIERRERSEIVNDLLRRHLHKYEITRKK